MDTDNKKTTKKIPLISLKDLVSTISPIHFNNLEDKEFESGDKTFDLETKEWEDSIKRDSKKYQVEIDWTQFNEPQIQMFIALLFQSIDYTVENWHQADPAREDGADLILRKHKESIAIAVKIKPKSQDRSQLIDLSRRKVNKKIYVYIQTPTGKFHDSMMEYKGQIDFWDPKKLNAIFISNNFGFASNIIFDSHDLSNTINETRQMLFGIRNKCLKLKKIDVKTLDWQSLMFLWRLKDIGVTLNKSNESIITLLEKPINIKNKQLNKHFVKIFLVYLDVLNDRLNSYLRYFQVFYEENRDLVHNSIISEIGRSHWSHLQQYRTDYNSISSLQKELKEAIRDKEQQKRQASSNKSNKYLNEMTKNNDIWAIMEFRVRNLMIFGAGTEEIIDDIFKEFAEQYIASGNP
jgi:hypothetical protein